MLQPEHIVETPGAAERFNPGEVIIEHVSNSSIDHPLIHLPTIAGIDFSVTKHVLMLWVVAALVFLIVSLTVRRYLRQERRIPTGFMNGLEFVVLYLRDNIVEPNVGRKWVNTWTPLLLTRCCTCPRTHSWRRCCTVGPPSPETTT
jgi:F0F1-type ATP synthase membrane subunit a